MSSSVPSSLDFDPWFSIDNKYIYIYISSILIISKRQMNNKNLRRIVRLYYMYTWGLTPIKTLLIQILSVKIFIILLF